MRKEIKSIEYHLRAKQLRVIHMQRESGPGQH